MRRCNGNGYGRVKPTSDKSATRIDTGEIAAERGSHFRKNSAEQMWVLKVYIIPLERAIRKTSYGQPHVHAHARAELPARVEAPNRRSIPRRRADPQVTRENVGATPPPAAHGPTVACCGGRHLGAASPHPHGRRQRLPRVLGEQQQQQRGEHLDVRERQLDKRIASRSRGFGGIVG